MKVQRAVPLMALFFACSAWAQKPELVVETGHTHDVTSVAFSPKGKIVASGGADGIVALWDVAAGHELIELGNEGSEIRTVAFSPDGTILASGGKDIKLWDVATGRELRTLKSSDSLVAFLSVAFSPDGKTLASAGARWIHDEPGSVLTLWDVATGVAVTTSKSPVAHRWQFPGIQSVAFSPDGHTLLAADGDEHKFSLRSASSGAELKNFAGAAAALSVAFNRDGKTMASADYDGTVKLWDVDTGRELANLGNGGRCVEFSPDGAILASGDKNIKLWDVATRRESRTLEGSDSERVNSIAFSPDGRILASGGYDPKGRTWGSFRPVLRLWDLTTDDQYMALESHVSSLHSVALSPDGILLASGGDDKSITIWNLTNRNALRTLSVHNHAVNSVAFSADGTTLASGSEDGIVKLWDVATERLRTFGSPEVFTSCCITALSADGSIVASTSKTYTPSHPDSPVRLWDVRSGLELPSLHGPIPFRSIALSPRGETLAAADERAITLWNVSEGRKFLTLPEGWDFGLTFSPDGKTLVSASVDKGTHVWDVANGRELLTLSSYGQSYAFSLDGRILAAAADTTIKLYDLASGRELRSFGNHGSTVSSITFQSDGRYLFSGSVDGWVRIWDPDTGTQVAALLALDQTDWVVVDSLGRFDASPGAMQIMHYVVEKHCGAEPASAESIDLNQLKSRYWEPELLSKIINRGPRRNVRAFDHVDPYPDVQILGEPDASGHLPVKLTSCGGGIGPVQVFVNDKQLTGDARGAHPDRNAQQLTLSVDLRGAPFILGKHNEIRIVAFNAEGYIKSRDNSKDYTPPATSVGTSEHSNPDLYAIVAGISHYADYDPNGDNLNNLTLRFSSGDAENMAKALQLAGDRLFGCDHVHIFLLSTYSPPAMSPSPCNMGSAPAANNVTWAEPTKANLAQAFVAARQARPEDTLVVYFSGHGVAFGDTYAYPTADAATIDPQDLSRDSALLSQTAITTDELAEWVRPPAGILATHEVVILDTCAAGAASVRFASMRAESGDQIRALDALAVNAGFHSLMGSSADAESWEASPYGQGLLTYALLQGMKGAALKNDVDVDVGKLFEYAVDTVPDLARGIGRSQNPQIFAPPGATSFPVGELLAEDKQRILLAAPKPVILAPRLLNAVELRDNLGLEPAVRKELRDRTDPRSRSGSAPPVVFVDAEEMSGAILPSGIYTVRGKQVTVNLVLTRIDRNVKLTVQGSTDDISAVAKKIVASMLEAARKFSP